MGRASRRRKAEADRQSRERQALPAAGPGWITTGLLIVLAAAALFRVAYFFQFRTESVFFDQALLDSRIYDTWARRIAGGEVRPDEPFYFAPGYPYALALLYRFASDSRTAIYVIQMLLGLLNIVLIHRLAGRAYGGRAALFAAILAALYGSFPFFETKIMAAVPALTVLLGAMVILAAASTGGKLWLWGAAGLLLGITSLIRPPTLVMAPFLLAWMAFWGAPLREPGSPRLSWRRFLPAAALLAAGWGLAMAPTALHNIQTGAGLTLISSQGGITFYQANNPRARGLYVALTGEGFSGSPAAQAREEKELAEKAIGRSLTRSEVSRYWFGRGLGFILDQPGRFAWLLGMKLLRFVGSYEYSTEYILYVERESAWLLWITFVPFALLVALAVPALFEALRTEPRRRAGPPPVRLNGVGWLVLAVLLSNLAVCLVFYVSSRYRLPAVPSVIVFAAATLATGVEAARKGLRGRVISTAAVVGVIFVVAHLEKDASAVYQEANVHYNTGNIWLRQEEYDRAIAEYERAVEMDDSRFYIWYNLGNAYRAQERWAEAAEAYARAGERQKKNVRAHVREGQMRMKAGQWEAAREAWLRAESLGPGRYDVQMALGRIAAATGRRQEAIRRFDRALALKPGDRVALQEKARL